jgi:S1-C subfamily serine protease
MIAVRANSSGAMTRITVDQLFADACRRVQGSGPCAALDGLRAVATKGTDYRRSVRTVALGGVLAVALAGCGGQTETVTGDASDPASRAGTGDASAPPLTVAPLTTRLAGSVPGAVSGRVRRSVLPVSCSETNAGDGFVGTGFTTEDGVVTASHVVGDCPSGTTLSFGYGYGTVSSDDPTHDLALVGHIELYPNQVGDPNAKPLQLEPRPAYVGQPLALLGIPAAPSFGSPFWRPVTVVPGTVIATHHAQVMMSAKGARKTLKDTIEVTVPGIAHGQSGGPAVDSAGRVVGVIEGSALGIATLTPVTELTSLR